MNCFVAPGFRRWSEDERPELYQVVKAGNMEKDIVIEDVKWFNKTAFKMYQKEGEERMRNLHTNDPNTD